MSWYLFYMVWLKPTSGRLLVRHLGVVPKVLSGQYVSIHSYKCTTFPILRSSWTRLLNSLIRSQMQQKPTVTNGSAVRHFVFWINIVGPYDGHCCVGGPNFYHSHFGMYSLGFMYYVWAVTGGFNDTVLFSYSPHTNLVRKRVGSNSVCDKRKFAILMNFYI